MKKYGSRRNFIRLSSMGLGGLILPATAATDKKIKATIYQLGQGKKIAA